jgi:hypothetical protein
MNCPLLASHHAVVSKTTPGIQVLAWLQNNMKNTDTMMD